MDRQGFSRCTPGIDDRSGGTRQACINRCGKELAGCPSGDSGGNGRLAALHLSGKL